MSNLIITTDPAREAGEAISDIIQRHDGDVVCVLAGGSAIDIIEYIHPGEECFHEGCVEDSSGSKTICKITECRTIFITGDERVSGESKINHSRQIEDRFRGRPIVERLIKTIPELHENEKSFSTRIENLFLENLVNLNNPKIIFTLGIGADGHTAGILPMDESSFRRVYQDDRIYVPVHPEGLRIDSRASFTPSWILSNADVIIGYVVGEDKRQILTELNQTDKKLNERPAEIFKLHKNATIYTDLDIS